MNERQQILADLIVSALLAVPDVDREDVCQAIRHNGVFCFACGIGSRERPNRNCQCGNDQ